MNRMTVHFFAAFVLSVALATLLSQPLAVAQEPSLAELEQQALRAATEAVADSVVQIRTIGGLDRVEKTLLSGGPTTGLIVSEDGYIVSSAFNFAGQPSSILVRLSNGKQLAAELVARDKNRMLVLLKISTEQPLPVPEASVGEQIRVGQWAVAVGRTFQAEQVDVSVGIVSALQRMYGRVLQTDANVSVANYGGPLVDVSGRVLGVLVPMSPKSAGGRAVSELAGAEFYDSGIGFAVPLEHVFSILDRWKEGDDLLPGKLGIGLKKGDVHRDAPTLTTVWRKSPAAVAGWQTDDVILAINGQAVATQADLYFQLKPRYAGESLQVTLKRGDEEIESTVTLVGELEPYRHVFLGVLPERNPSDEKLAGVALRGVWPDSPASAAGLLVGDLITKIEKKAIKSIADARGAMAGFHPGDSVPLIVTRGEEELTLTAILSTVPEIILSSNDLETDGSEPEEQQDAEEAKFQTLKIPEFSQEAVYYSPGDKQDESLGLLFWLGDGNEEHNQTLLGQWQAVCRRDGLHLLIAPPEEEGTWATGDLSYLQQLARAASKRLSVDSQRMVVVGQAKAGQLAYALAFNSHGAITSVVSIDAPLPRTLKLPGVTPATRLAVLAIESRNSNFAPLIHRDLKQLRESGYPTTWLQRPATTEDSKDLNAATRASIARWVEGLDRF